MPAPSTPSTLDATVGGSASNTYATLVEFRQYWLNRPQNTDANALTDVQAEAALLLACLVLDSAFQWNGTAADVVTPQARCWPRNGMVDRVGYALPTTVVPTDLKSAQCQLAGDLAAGDKLADNDPLKQGITGLKAGSVSLSFANVLALGDVQQMDAALRRMGPEFDWASKNVSDACRLLLVPSWYARAPLMRPLSFGVSR